MSGEEQAANKGAEEKQTPGGTSEEAGKKSSNDGAKTEAQQVSPQSSEPPAETLKLGAEEMIKRRSRWQSSLAALRYVSSVSQDNEVKLRDTDRATSLFLLIVCFFALLTVFLPLLAVSQPELPKPVLAFLLWMALQKTNLVLIADVLVGFGLLSYVANRFGIMTTLTPRQALLSWHLMLGSSLLGIFLAINLAMVCWVVVEHTNIVIPEAHPGATAPGAATPRTK